MFAGIMNASYQPSWHHFEIAEKLEDVYNGKIDRLMIFMPPRHGKSELASVMFPAWVMGKDPTKKFIATSYSAELATDFGYRVRNTIQDNQYKAIFSTFLREDSKAKNNWRTEQGGQYVAVGVGGPITGRGADILLIDDPVKNREEADSHVFQDKILRWYTSTAYTRLHKGGAVVLIMTRWSDNDLAGKLLEQNPDEWTVVKFPAIAQEDEQYRKNGEALWPQRYDKETLLRIKDNIGPDWSPLYQQEPFDLADAVFKKEWVQYWGEGRELKTLPSRLKIRIIVDLASSSDKRSDESSILVVAVDANRNRYVLESFGDWGDEGRRFDPGEIVDQIYFYADKYAEIDPSLVLYVESVSYQRTLMYWLKEYAKKRIGKVYRVEEIKTPTTQTKEEKIKGLIPFMSNGMIFFRQERCQELIEQMMRFPKGKRVDRLDTLAMDLDFEKRPSMKMVMPNLKFDPRSGRVIKYS